MREKSYTMNPESNNANDRHITYVSLMAEIEISVLSGQCLAEKMASIDEMRRKVSALKKWVSACIDWYNVKAQKTEVQSYQRPVF
jgi:uncharacterized protein YlzI (FlbEa/FlbD family)